MSKKINVTYIVNIIHWNDLDRHGSTGRPYRQIHIDAVVSQRMISTVDSCPEKMRRRPCASQTCDFSKRDSVLAGEEITTVERYSEDTHSFVLWRHVYVVSFVFGLGVLGDARFLVFVVAGSAGSSRQLGTQRPFPPVLAAHVLSQAKVQINPRICAAVEISHQQ